MQEKSVETRRENLGSIMSQILPLTQIVNSYGIVFKKKQWEFIQTIAFPS